MPQKNSPFQINSVGMGSPVIVGGITAQTIRTGTETIRESQDGDIHPSSVHITSVKPGATWTTTDIETVLDAVALSGICITSDVSHDGIDAYGREWSCGGPAAGSVHRKYTLSNGVLAPRTISVDHRGNASLNLEMLAISVDGSTSPLAIADNAALLASPAAAAKRWTIGPIDIAGTVLEWKRSFEIDFGNDIQTEGGDSDIYDKFGGVDSSLSVISLRGLDPKWASATNIPLTGKNAAHADTSIYLRQKGVADATPGHIRITIAGIAYPTTLHDANGNGYASNAVQLEPVHDGTNVPVLVTTNTTIP